MYYAPKPSSERSDLYTKRRYNCRPTLSTTDARDEPKDASHPSHQISAHRPPATPSHPRVRDKKDQEGLNQRVVEQRDDALVGIGKERHDGKHQRHNQNLASNPGYILDIRHLTAARIDRHKPTAHRCHNHTDENQENGDELRHHLARDVQPRQEVRIITYMVKVQRTIQVDKQKCKYRHEDNHRNLI